MDSTVLALQPASAFVHLGGNGGFPAAGAGPGVCALPTTFSGGLRRARANGSLPGPSSEGTVAGRQMCMGRIQAQTAGYVLCLHHAQTPEELPGLWEALPHPTVRLHLGHSLTHLEGSPVQSNTQVPALLWPRSAAARTALAHVLSPPQHPQNLRTSSSDQCRAGAGL